MDTVDRPQTTQTTDRPQTGAARQPDGHAEAAPDGAPGGPQRADGERERTRAESKPTERPLAGDGRHADTQRTLDRHAQRQIDRKLERQWTTGRHLDRAWSESRPADAAVDWQWTEGRRPGGGGRRAERAGPAPHLPQRPLPPYPSDWTPSPRQEADPLRSLDSAALAVGERPPLHTQETPSDRHGQSEGWGACLPAVARPVRPSQTRPRRAANPPCTDAAQVPRPVAPSRHLSFKQNRNANAVVAY